MKHVIFLMGPTNSGKTTLIKHAISNYNAYGVFVGKMLRDKYGAEYFNGQQAPEHTKQEAKDMMLEGIKYGIEHYPITIVDGQPREESQIEIIIQHVISDTSLICQFIMLNCSKCIRKKRALARDMDEASLKLSMARMDNDDIELDDIRDMLLSNGIPVLDMPAEDIAITTFDKWINNFKI